jgi:hypothetical protein
VCDKSAKDKSMPDCYRNISTYVVCFPLIPLLLTQVFFSDQMLKIASLSKVSKYWEKSNDNAKNTF